MRGYIPLSTILSSPDPFYVHFPLVLYYYSIFLFDSPPSESNLAGLIPFSSFRNPVYILILDLVIFSTFFKINELNENIDIFSFITYLHSIKKEGITLLFSYLRIHINFFLLLFCKFGPFRFVEASLPKYLNHI